MKDVTLMKSWKIKKNHKIELKIGWEQANYCKIT